MKPLGGFMFENDWHKTQTPDGWWQIWDDAASGPDKHAICMCEEEADADKILAARAGANQEPDSFMGLIMELNDMMHESDQWRGYAYHKIGCHAHALWPADLQGTCSCGFDALKAKYPKLHYPLTPVL